MAAPIFREEWAQEWCRRINQNDSYRRAAERWEGAIVLLMTEDDSFGIDKERAVIADLWHGECRSGHAAGDTERGEAPFVISGTPSTWKKILDGDADPIVSLMGGKLKLTRGGLFKLLPYAKAAKELVNSARDVDTRFPAGWK